MTLRSKVKQLFTIDTEPAPPLTREILEQAVAQLEAEKVAADIEAAFGDHPQALPILERIVRSADFIYRTSGRRLEFLALTKSEVHELYESAPAMRVMIYAKDKQERELEDRARMLLGVPVRIVGMVMSYWIVRRADGMSDLGSG